MERLLLKSSFFIKRYPIGPRFTPWNFSNLVAISRRYRENRFTFQGCVGTQKVITFLGHTPWKVITFQGGVHGNSLLSIYTPPEINSPWNSDQIRKDFDGVNLGPLGYLLMKKTRFQNSRATVPFMSYKIYILHVRLNLWIKLFLLVLDDECVLIFLWVWEEVHIYVQWFMLKGTLTTRFLVSFLACMNRKGLE